MKKEGQKTICILMPGHWSHVMGGAQYQVKQLVESLTERKCYQVIYLAKNFDKDYKPKNYRLVAIKNPWKYTRRFLFFDSWELLRRLKEVKPDIIYQRVGCAYTGVSAYYAQKYGCRLIWHISSDSDVKPYKFRIAKDAIFRYVDKKFLEYGVRKASEIVAQTEEQATLLKQNYNRLPSAIVRNFHPLATERILKNKPITVVWIANLKPLKQPEVFVSLAQDLQQHTDARFVIIGGMQGSPRWRRYLTSLFEKVSNFDYLGACTQEEVNAVLAKASILVNTSLWEGFSNTFIQAWMRKVPVISMNVNPNRLLSDGKIGLVSGSYSNLRDDVLRVIKDTELRIQMGENAQKYAFANHSEKNIDSLIEFIDSKVTLTRNR